MMDMYFFKLVQDLIFIEYRNIYSHYCMFNEYNSSILTAFDDISTFIQLNAVEWIQQETVLSTIPKTFRFSTD